MTETTGTVTSIIASDDRSYASVVGSRVIVSTGKHDYTPETHASIFAHEGEVFVRVADAMNHAVFWMPTDEARLLAQAILDATA